LKAFNALIEIGHTVVVVEHNIDVIKCADWIIDLGPKGGEEGGHLVFEGIPENLIKNKESITAIYLKEKL
jgi:excinuclease ABC subunit A